jgi:predicted peptidase
MPQCRAGDLWWSPKMNAMVSAVLDQTFREYPIDRSRLYLTGLSLGGAGAWLMAAGNPSSFAALSPVCGFVGNPNVPPDDEAVQRVAAALDAVPIWCFHGALDEAVMVAHSRAMVERLRRRGANVQYTEIPDGKHAIWDRVYDDPRWWDWLLSQRLRPASAHEAASQPPP